MRLLGAGRSAILAFPVALFLTLPSAARAAIRIDEFPVDGGVNYVIAGPDGAMWFTTGGGVSIGRVTLDGQVHVFPAIGNLSSLAVGADRQIWFPQAFTPFVRPYPPPVAKIGQMTLSGAVTIHPLPDPNSFPRDIISGPDGGVWFGEAHAIGRMDRDARLSETAYGSVPHSLVFGPDGQLYFAGNSGFERLDAGGPTVISPEKIGGSVCVGPDGNFWYTSPIGAEAPSFIGRMTLSGIVTRFPLPGGIAAIGITAGPDGNVWFSADGAGIGWVGSIAPDGSLTLDGLPNTDFAGAIALGSDGNLWVGESAAVARVTILSPDSCRSDGSSLCLGGRFRATLTFSAGSSPQSAARPIPLTSDTGAFWFFTSSNVEVVLKVVDGRAVNSRFWVFVGGLTDVEYDLLITDTETGREWRRHKPAGELASFADTAAF